MCLALKALVQSKPGAAPQEIGSKLQASAEGATHAFMTRAFSADVFLVLNPGALPQADMRRPPLALNISIGRKERFSSAEARQAFASFVTFCKRNRANVLFFQ